MGVDELKYGRVFPHDSRVTAMTILAVTTWLYFGSSTQRTLSARILSRGLKTRDLKQNKKTNIIYAFTRKYPYSCYQL